MTFDFYHPLYCIVRNDFYGLVSSLVRLDPDLFESQENGWRGVLSYYQQGGQPGDPWGGNPSSFRERNTTFVPLADNQHLKIFETCNFASNLAYYHMNLALASYHDWVLPAGVVRALKIFHHFN